jgi:ribosome biogenesis GTPase / thiamine phosphate phosphatase
VIESSPEQHDLEGIVVRTHGGHYYVQPPAGPLMDCVMRGRLKKTRLASDLVALGDRVRWSPTEEGVGVIEEVLPRNTVLSRAVPPPRPAKKGISRYAASQQNKIEQIILANPDQVLIVFAVHNPPLSPLMLDRYLVACEAVRLPGLIVANKSDLLADEDEAEHEILALYAHIGYNVHHTSTVTGEGLGTLRTILRGKLSVLTGPSGTGKSSLLNALWPGLDLRVGEISEYHDRGKHTTVVASLLNPEPGTFVADTPGMRQFRFWDIEPEQLEAFFPEMRPYLGQCRFTPCTHTHEPDCAVRQAVERGEIHALRYESYYRMFEHGF